jgi:hypothetical protein
MRGALSSPCPTILPSVEGEVELLLLLQRVPLLMLTLAASSVHQRPWRGVVFFSFDASRS